MPVTVADFQANVTRYLQLTSKEDIFIMQNEKVIAKLAQPPQEKISHQVILPRKLTKRANCEEISAAINSLISVLPDEGMTLFEYKAERLVNHENFA